MKCRKCGVEIRESAGDCPSCRTPTAVLTDGPTKALLPTERAIGAALPGGDPLVAASAAAQQRADRIAAFRAELNELRSTGVLRLDEDDLATVERHHEAILRDLVHTFDVDVSERGNHLSLGMRIVSLIGAIALATSAFYFFYRIWGVISLPVQIAILVVAPASGLLATAVLAARERSGYFTSMAGLVAFAGFVLNARVLSTILNLEFTPWEFLSWGLFAMILAYAYRLRLLLVLGVSALAMFLASGALCWIGAHWPGCFLRPESFLPAGVLALLFPVLVSHRDRPGFASLHRILGLLLLFLPVVVLAAFGYLSFLPLGKDTIQTLYEVLGFAGATGVIWLGIARRQKELVYGGSVAFVFLLYVKFVDWWWDWMPKYLFFLIVGLTAIGVLLVLKRLRAAITAIGQEARQ